MPTRRRLLALTFAGLAPLGVLAACGDDGGGGTNDIPHTFVPPSSAMSPGAQASSTLPDPNPQGQSPGDPDGPGDVDQGGSDSPESTVDVGSGDAEPR